MPRKRRGGRGRGKAQPRVTRASEAAPAPDAPVPENDETMESDTEAPEQPEVIPATDTSESAETLSPMDVDDDAEGKEDGKSPIHEEAKEEEKESQQESTEEDKDKPSSPPPPTEPETPAAAPIASTSSASPADTVAPTTTSPGDIEQLGPKPDYASQLLTDKSYLIDVGVGYGIEENLKIPLKGFNADDELQLFPVIESVSAKLYNIVQEMSADQKRAIHAAIKVKKGIIKFPNMPMKSYVCQMKFVETPTPKEKATPSKRTPHPFLLTEDENMFTEDKLKLLRAVLDAGWKREVVMRSPESKGRKTGDVYYYAPDGTKFRSSKQVAQHLAEVSDCSFTLENFSFAKVRISTNPDQEIVRKAYDGKSPPRYPPKPVVTKGASPARKPEPSKAPPKPSSSKDLMDTETRSIADEPVKTVSSRRSIQPPKRYSDDTVLLLPKRSKAQDEKYRNSNSNKGLMQMGMLPPKYPKGMEDSSSNLSELDYDGSSQEEAAGSNSVAMKELAEDSLFQISALRQSGGIDVDNMQRLVESHKQAQKAAVADSMTQQGRSSARPTAGGSKAPVNVIPCSIRCPGMQGVIPTLQCTRCLCLFHAECLGLPPNLLFNNKYLCTNCTEQGPSSSSAASGSGNQQKNIILKKPSEVVKRGPPGLAPIPQGSIRGPAPSRDVTVTIGSKESPTRVPQKVMLTHVSPARGIGRARGGGPPPHIRPSAAAHHMTPGHRRVASDGSSFVVSPIPTGMKRGRGRPPAAPPSRAVPPTLSKNLTITHLPKFGHGPPPVPNLQPMGTPKGIPGKLSLPVMPGKPRPAMPTVPNLMKPNAFRLTVPPPSLSGRTFKKILPAAAATNTSSSNLRLNQATTTVMKIPPSLVSHDKTVSLIKRYPQSVCTVGNKKFVVLPKSAAAFMPPTMVGNGAIAKANFAMDGMRNPETTVKKIEAVSMREGQINSTGDDSSPNVPAQPVSDEKVTETSNDHSTDDADGMNNSSSMEMEVDKHEGEEGSSAVAEAVVAVNE